MRPDQLGLIPPELAARILWLDGLVLMRGNDLCIRSSALALAPLCDDHQEANSLRQPREEMLERMRVGLLIETHLRINERPVDGVSVRKALCLFSSGIGHSDHVVVRSESVGQNVALRSIAVAASTPALNAWNRGPPRERRIASAIGLRAALFARIGSPDAQGG